MTCTYLGSKKWKLVFDSGTKVELLESEILEIKDMHEELEYNEFTEKEDDGKVLEKQSQE